MGNSRIQTEVDVHKLATDIKNAARKTVNEEELKIEFAGIIKKILSSWGIEPAYERHASGSRGVFSGRKDALYGRVIIEFKAPGKFENKKEFEKAKDQVRNYIIHDAVVPGEYGRYFGVVLDGYYIGFVRYRRGEWEESPEPMEINAQTVMKLLEAIRGLKRKPLDVRFLLSDFGPKSELTRNTIMTLYNALEKPSSPRTEILFEDWKRVFSQVCAYSPEKLKGLIKYYELDKSKKIDTEKLMFAIHTYYTILMKLLTSEIVTLFADSLIGSYLKKLEDAYLSSNASMLDELKNMEEGGIFADLGIKNFLEADYFAWYLDEWNNDIKDGIHNIVTKLLDYEPATVELTPERIKDLFKRLYQNLVPKDIRHKLGEYFTPDWLAELVLERVGYDGNPDKKLLDPACGSGTFLVLAIKKIREYAEDHFIDKRDLLTKIVKNVQGIDLNPLAVMASKANYIIALADLLRYRSREGIEIPVYLADSITVYQRQTLKGNRLYLVTSVGEFNIPYELVEKKALSVVLDIIDFCLQNNYSKSIFREFLVSRIKERYDLSQDTIELITNLYETFLSLEKEGKNRIWTRILKNSFAPMFIGQFDYVVGNPPWINWEHLPASYRENTKDLWIEYGLQEKTKGTGLGKVKKDISMLFVARCLDRFTKENGKLAFLIPFTVFKTQAGAGFRKFLAPNFTKIKERDVPRSVIEVHDLVTLYPFENAVNRTSLIILEKKGKTKFPIPCIVWQNPRSKGIDQEAELHDVYKDTRQYNLVMYPIKKTNPETPWMQISEKTYNALQKIIGSSPWYKAHAGVYTALNQVYWIEILAEQPNGILVTNPPLPGQKKKVKQVKQVIEKDLVYPLVRGRDVKKWYVKQELGYILLPVDKNGKTLSHKELKIKYPLTWKYFINFVIDLTNRGGEPYKSKLKPYREKPFEIAERIAPPFYWLFNVSPSLSSYKVVWKRIAGAITGKAVSFVSAVLEPYNDVILGRKPVVLNDSMIMVSLDNRDEAYYLSGVLNSSLILLGIASYTYELRQETHITRYIRIPKYNPRNKVHRKISSFSLKAHELSKKIYENDKKELLQDLMRIENSIDMAVAKLYGISDEDFAEVKQTLYILRNEEVLSEDSEK